MNGKITDVIVGKALAGILLAAIAAGFVYGALERKDEAYVDQVIAEHTSYDNISPTPQLIFACSRKHPIFYYNLSTREVTKNLVETESYRKMQALLDSLNSSSVAYVMGTGATVFGAKRIWTDFQEGKAKGGQIIQVIGSVIAGFPLGYWIAESVFDVNCEAKSVFQRMSEAKAWEPIKNRTFIRMFAAAAENRCVPSSARPNDPAYNMVKQSLGMPQDYASEVWSLAKKVYAGALEGADFGQDDFKLLAITVDRCEATTIKKSQDQLVKYMQQHPLTPEQEQKMLDLVREGAAESDSSKQP